MYTFTMVGCTLFKFCHFKCAKAYLLEILGMSRLWHDLMAHAPILLYSVLLLKKMRKIIAILATLHSFISCHTRAQQH